MVKKIVIVSIILVLLAASVLLLALLNINSLVAIYKPELERIASEALGTRVELGELKTSIFPAAKIEAHSIKIKSAEKSNQTLSVGTLTLDLQLRPLLSKELKIDSLKIDSPSISLIKNKTGVEVSGLPRKDTSASNLNMTASAPENSEKAPQLNISLREINIDNGSVSYADLGNEAAPKKFTITKIKLSTAFDFADNQVSIPKLNLSGRISDQNAFEVNTTGVKFVPSTGIAEISAGRLNLLDQNFNYSGTINTKSSAADLKANFEGFDLKKLSALGESVGLSQDLNLVGSLNNTSDLHYVKADQFTLKSNSKLSNIALQLGNRKISDLNASIETSLDPSDLALSLSEVNLKLDQTPVSASGKINYQLKNQEAVANFSNLKIFGGSATLALQAWLQSEKRFQESLTATKLSIAQLISFATPNQPARMNGTIDQIKADLSGALEGDIARSASGRIDLSISQGALLGINFVAKVLNEVNSIPLLSGALAAYVPPAYKSVLTSQDTPIRKLQGTFALKNGVLTTSNLHIESDVFWIDVDGTITLDSNLDLNTTIFFTKEFSEALASTTPGLKKIFAADGRLTFPLAVKGKSPAIIVVPNLKKLIDIAGKRVLKDGAEQLLDRTLKKTPGANEAKRAIEGLLGF